MQIPPQSPVGEFAPGTFKSSGWVYARLCQESLAFWLLCSLYTGLTPPSLTRESTSQDMGLLLLRTARTEVLPWPISVSLQGDKSGFRLYCSEATKQSV